MPDVDGFVSATPMTANGSFPAFNGGFCAFSHALKFAGLAVSFDPTSAVSLAEMYACAFRAEAILSVMIPMLSTMSDC